MAGRGELDDIEAFIADTGVGEFEHAVDTDGTLWRTFGVTTQPAFVFVDDSGSVALHYGAMGHDDLDTVLGELVAN